MGVRAGQERADQLLVERGLAVSRSQAQRLIAAGVQWRWPLGVWQPVHKNGDVLPLTCEIQLLDEGETRYVSRGGLKLEAALALSGVSVSGLVCLDLGQSTGGFTDCLLRHGAAHVSGIDVGHGQLHPRLRDDPRVSAHEKCHARDLHAAMFEPLWRDRPQHLAGFDLIVGDLSFISLTRVLPHVAPLCKPQGHCLLLVKPQFELQPADIGKGGLVKDPALYAQVRQRIEAACTDVHLPPLAWWPSPVLGGDGNREFFIHAWRAA